MFHAGKQPKHWN